MKAFTVVNPEVLVARRAERLGLRPPLWGVRRGDVAFLGALRAALAARGGNERLQKSLHSYHLVSPRGMRPEDRICADGAKVSGS